MDLARDPRTFVDERNSGEFHYSSEPPKFAAENPSQRCLPGETFVARRTISRTYVMPKPPIRCGEHGGHIYPTAAFQTVATLMVAGRGKPRGAARQAAPTGVAGMRSFASLR